MQTMNKKTGISRSTNWSEWLNDYLGSLENSKKLGMTEAMRIDSLEPLERAVDDF
jgi:hypothetical protein